MLFGGVFAQPMPAAAAPDWLAAFICHAPSSDGDRQAPADTHHGHCQFCQAGHVSGLIPQAAFVPPVGGWALVRLAISQASWPILSARRFYASRAPPSFC